MIIEELDEFKRDVKLLLKKYRSLNDDLAIVKKILLVLPNERPPFSYRINNLGIETCVIKVKKIACKAVKGKGVNSGLRLVYAYFENNQEHATTQAPKPSGNQKTTTNNPIYDSNEIGGTKELTTNKQNSEHTTGRIVFIELYHKNNKPLEDRDRILRHFSK